MKTLEERFTDLIEDQFEEAMTGSYELIINRVAANHAKILIFENILSLAGTIEYQILLDGIRVEYIKFTRLGATTITSRTIEFDHNFEQSLCDFLADVSESEVGTID